MNKKLKLEDLSRLSPEEFIKAEKIPISLLLENIRSLHNVGSAFRTADAFRLEKIILAGYTPVPPQKEIRKTALGAEENVAWEKNENPLEFLKKKKGEGYKVYSLEQTSQSISLEALQYDRLPKILVLGNEVDGVSQEIIDLSDASIEIPQFGTKHSLNVSVALGIACWKMLELELKHGLH